MKTNLYRALIPLVLLPISSLACITYWPAEVWEIERVFSENRDEFHRITEEATAQYLEQDERFKIYSPLFEYAWVYETKIPLTDPSERVVIQFIFGNVYIPLLYIAADDPRYANPPCMYDEGDKLDTHWYICYEEWN